MLFYLDLLLNQFSVPTCKHLLEAHNCVIRIKEMHHKVVGSFSYLLAHNRYTPHVETQYFYRGSHAVLLS